MRYWWAEPKKILSIGSSIQIEDYVNMLFRNMLFRVWLVVVPSKLIFFE